MEQYIPKPDKNYPVVVRCFTYNHEPYIEDALKGFVMQITNFDFCVLVVDDCSTDGTAQIIREYEKRYPSIIKGFYLQENYYLRENEKYGLIKEWRANCKYEAMCEGDDFWTDPHKLQKEYDYLESHPDLSLVYTDCNVFFHDEGILHQSVFTTGFFKHTHNYKDFILEGKYLAPCSWFYKIDEYSNIQVLPFSTDGTLCKAFELLVQDKVGYINDTTSTYRVVHGSASHCNDIEKKYKYIKGVYVTEKHYINKYSEMFNDNDMIVWLKRKYMIILPYAIAMGDKEIIEKIKSNKTLRLPIKSMMMLWFSNFKITKYVIASKLKRSVKKGL